MHNFSNPNFIDSSNPVSPGSIEPVESPFKAPYEAFEKESAEYRACCGKVHIETITKICAVYGIIFHIFAAIFGTVAFFGDLGIISYHLENRFSYIGIMVYTTFSIIFYHVPVFFGIKATRPAYLMPFIVSYIAWISLWSLFTGLLIYCFAAGMFYVLTVKAKIAVAAVIVILCIALPSVMVYFVIRCRRYLLQKKSYEGNCIPITDSRRTHAPAVPTTELQGSH